MKLKLSKPIIENILSVVTNFTEKKDDSQITSHIYIEANENIIIKATDNEFGVIYIDNSSEVIQTGKTTINGKKFYEIIKALNDDIIEFEEENNIATISQNKSMYKLPTFDATSFPEFPDIKNFKKIDINSIEFIDGLKKTYLAIDNNNPKYELNGALIDVKENLNIVSTDTKRLAIYSIKNQTTDKASIIIPKKAISEIKKLFIDNFDLFINDTHLIIKSDNITFFTQLINGSFPNYERIIPTEYKHIVKINKSSFLKAIKQINIISFEVKLTFNQNKLHLESISDETFEAQTDIEIESEVTDFKFAVNSKFILDFLSVIDDEIIDMCLNEENIPFTLKSKNFQTIIMPLTI